MGSNMAFNSTALKTTLAAPILAVAFAANAQSLPFETGKCYDGPSVEAATQKDGQKPVFLGKRPVIGGNLAGNVITMNDNGYGYNLERDPDSQKLCIRASFNNIQLNYVDNPVIPAWGQSIKPNKGIDVQNAYRPENGGRLVFRAQTYSKDSNGNEVPGKSIVIATGTIEGKGMGKAAVWSVNSQGIPDSSFNMIDFKIVTTNFSHFMGRGFGSGFASNGSSGTLVAAKAPELTPTR
jgi:hypothetical protein